MAKQKQFILRNDAKTLNRMFYQQFDPELLFTKAGTLWFINEHREKFREFVAACDGVTEALDTQYFSALLSEIHFTYLHQCETFFALVFARFQSLAHWLYLTTYKTSDIKAKVQQYLDKDFTRIGGKDVHDARTFLHHGVYTGIIMDKEIPEGKSWDTALDNLDHFLRIVARKYLKGEEYNAYKHGIRVLHGHQSLKIHPPGEPDKHSFKLESDNAITFLELVDKNEGGLTVHSTTKFFNPTEDFAHMEMLANLSNSIRNTRVEYYGGKAKKREVTMFFDLDRKQLQDITEITNWTVTI